MQSKKERKGQVKNRSAIEDFSMTFFYYYNFSLILSLFPAFLFHRMYLFS